MPISAMQQSHPSLHQELTGLKYGSTLQVPIWGRIEIEGSIICRKYNVKLHVIESNPWYANDKQQEPFLHQLIDDSGLRNSGEYNKVDYTNSSILHIINRGCSHFEPILRKEAQQTLSYSDLTQVQSMSKELSLGQIEDCSLLEGEKLEKLKSFFKAYPSLNVNFQVNQYNDILLFCQKCKQSLDMNMRYLAKGEGIRRGKKIIERTGKNSDVIFLMENNLKIIPNTSYYLKVKEAFLKHAETVSRDYSNLLESEHDNAARSRSFQSSIKRLSNVKKLGFLFGQMNFKDVCAPVEEFVGRQEQIEEIYRKLQEGAVIIVGPSGIGKTQLARKFVEENKQVYLHAYEVNAQDMLSIERIEIFTEKPTQLINILILFKKRQIKDYARTKN